MVHSGSLKSENSEIFGAYFGSLKGGFSHRKLQNLQFVGYPLRIYIFVKKGPFRGVLGPPLRPPQTSPSPRKLPSICSAKTPPDLLRRSPAGPGPEAPPLDNCSSLRSRTDISQRNMLRIFRGGVRSTARSIAQLPPHSVAPLLGGRTPPRGFCPLVATLPPSEGASLPTWRSPDGATAPAVPMLDRLGYSPNLNKESASPTGDNNSGEVGMAFWPGRPDWDWRELCWQDV